MIGKIFNFINKYKNINKKYYNLNHTFTKIDKIDIEKIKSNLEIIDHETFLCAIYQESSIYHNSSAHKMLETPIDSHDRSKNSKILNKFYLEDHDEEYEIEFEEEYQFILVKKAQPNPTVVMPTKLLQQINDKAINADFEPLNINRKDR